MRPFTTAELNRMRSASLQRMVDVGVVLRHTTGPRDLRGQPTTTYVPQPATRCTVVITTAREALSEATQAAITDAQVFVPYNTVIGPQDRFQLTQRFGQAITPITYSVIGHPVPDVATMRVGLRVGETT